MHKTKQHAFAGNSHSAGFLFMLSGRARKDFRSLPMVLLLTPVFLGIFGSGVGGVSQKQEPALCLSTKIQTGTSPAVPSKEDLRLAVIKAVKQGNAAVVRRLLAQGASPNSREILPILPRADPHSMPQRAPEEPLLILATRQGNIEVLKLLLKAGAKVDARGEVGTTPLMEAIRYHHNAVPIVIPPYSGSIRRFVAT